VRGDRRTILKSAGTLLGASVFSGNMSNSFAQKEGGQTMNARRLHKNMIGFMLAHEQFPVPELIEIGPAAEQAGFDLLATSDHLQAGK
jgi:F420-dependent hydroxymycolic acid dehydrogenase